MGSKNLAMMKTLRVRGQVKLAYVHSLRVLKPRDQAKGTLETKPIASVTKEVVKEYLITRVFPSSYTKHMDKVQ